MHAKDLYEGKYQYTKILIKVREKVGIDHFNDPKAYIKYSNVLHDVYKHIDDCNPDIENKTLIVFDDMIADMIHSKKRIQ